MMDLAFVKVIATKMNSFNIYMAFIRISALFCVVDLMVFPAISAPLVCNSEFRQEIVTHYLEGFHGLWGMHSKREHIEDVMSSLAGDLAALVARRGANPCRFSQLIDRPKPVTGSLGPRLVPDAKSMPVLFEFVLIDSEYCIGLNNKSYFEFEPNTIFPSETRISSEELHFKYTYFAMKCFEGGVQNGRYLYN